MTRTLAALALCLGLTSFGAFAKDHTEAAQKRYTCSYCNSLTDPASCCWKIAGCETVERAGGKFCQQKSSHSTTSSDSSQSTPHKAAKPKGKALEPYKPMGLAKKSQKRQPTFTCDYCNTVTKPESCCYKVDGCHMGHAPSGDRICLKNQ